MITDVHPDLIDILQFQFDTGKHPQLELCQVGDDMLYWRVKSSETIAFETWLSGMRHRGYVCH